jgi:hypothetical protein
VGVRLTVTTLNLLGKKIAKARYVGRHPRALPTQALPLSLVLRPCDEEIP